MKPIFLTLSEHGTTTFTINPKDPEPLQKAAAQICGIGTCKRFVGGGEASGTEPALEFFAQRHNECITITVTAWYYVGFDWIIPGILGVHVLPKLEQESQNIDILGMLSHALEERENLDYLDGLLHIDFQQPVQIDTAESPGLNLFVITAYLSVLARIVRKGLKRNFFTVDEIYRRKIRGHVLFSRTITGQHTPRVSDRLCCRRQDMGIDTPENKFLKYALRLVLKYLQKKSSKLHETATLIEQSRILLRAFISVSDKTIVAKDVAPFSNKVNPLFRDYREALRLAQKILRLETISCAASSSHGSTPVHWINMPKLFELYAYAKLRKKLHSHEFIRYQYGTNWQYPDFLCKSDEKSLSEGAPPFFVADAKYKPRYADGNHGMLSDIRQLAGYSRLCGILDEFQHWGRSNRNHILPCIIIYSDQQLRSDELDWTRLEKIPRWESFYKIGIRLPEKVFLQGSESSISANP